MAKSKKKVSKQVTIVVVFLVALQILFIAYYNSKPKALTISQAIDNAVSRISDPRRREQARLFAAIKSFQGTNSRLPSSLNELLPIYFEIMPIDPVTGKIFEYKVTGNKFSLGKNIDDNKLSPINIKSDKSEFATLNLLELQNSQDQFVFDPTGMRDPFMPFNIVPIKDFKGKSPLERFTLGQLKLTAVMNGLDEPQALVETSDGKGFTVKKGTKIGTDNGIVAEIQANKIIILESTTDFAGEQKNRTIELKLRTKDQSEEEN